MFFLFSCKKKKKKVILLILLTPYIHHHFYNKKNLKIFNDVNSVNKLSYDGFCFYYDVKIHVKKEKGKQKIREKNTISI